jgi:hypothetical protein
MVMARRCLGLVRSTRLRVTEQPHTASHGHLQLSIEKLILGVQAYTEHFGSEGLNIQDYNSQNSNKKHQKGTANTDTNTPPYPYSKPQSTPHNFQSGKCITCTKNNIKDAEQPFHADATNVHRYYRQGIRPFCSPVATRIIMIIMTALYKKKEYHSAKLFLHPDNNLRHDNIPETPPPRASLTIVHFSSTARLFRRRRSRW